MNTEYLQFALNMHLAAGRLDDVKLMLSRGADPNWYDSKRTEGPAMHIAVKKGFIEGMEALYAAGARIDSQTSGQRTSLMIAAENGNEGSIQWLLEHGADPAFINFFGESALYLSVENKHLECGTVLLRHSPSLREEELATLPSRLLDRHINLDVVHWLLREGMSPDVVVKKYDRPLLVHCIYSRDIENVESIIDLLLEAGVDVNARCADKSTALQVAAYAHDESLVMKLLRAGADTEMQDAYGQSATSIMERFGTESMRNGLRLWKASQVAHKSIQGDDHYNGLKLL